MYALNPIGHTSNSVPRRTPYGQRITVVAVYDGVFDLSGYHLYLPTGSRRREPSRRLLPETLRHVPVQSTSDFPRFAAMVYDESLGTLEPVEMPAYAPLVIG